MVLLTMEGLSQANTPANESLDEALSFYLNPYLRHYDFNSLRYSLDSYLDGKREQVSQVDSEEQRIRAHAIGRHIHR